MSVRNVNILGVKVKLTGKILRKTIGSTNGGLHSHMV